MQFDDRSRRESRSLAIDRIADAAADRALLLVDGAATAITRYLDDIIGLHGPYLDIRDAQGIDDILEALRPRLEKTILQSSLAATYTGAAEVMSRVPVVVADQAAAAGGGDRKPPRPPDLPGMADADGEGAVDFPLLREAVATLRQSPVFVGADYRETAQHARHGAFAITADITHGAAAKVRDILAANMRKGGGRREFQREVLEAIGSDAEGSPLADGHLRNIFRTNTAQQFQQGAAKALRAPLVDDWFPYRKQVVTHDRRTRPDHRILEKTGLNGTAIYHRDDPVWQTLGGAHDYQCRCTFIPVTVELAAEHGVREARDWLARARDLAERFGGRFEDYLAESKPLEFERVPWPTWDGKPILPSPTFRRDGAP